MRLARRHRPDRDFNHKAKRATDEFIEWRFPERAALAICRDRLWRVRIAMSECVRTGSRSGLQYLAAERTRLSTEIEELESILKH